MIETREKEIKGSRYTVTQLPARRAIALKAKLIKLLGPSLMHLFNLSKDKSDEDNSCILSKAIETLADKLDPVEFENLIVQLLATARKDGKELLPHVIDIEFAGDMEALYTLLIFALEVNYENFLSLVGLNIGSLFQGQKENPALTKKTFKKASHQS